MLSDSIELQENVGRPSQDCEQQTLQRDLTDCTGLVLLQMSLSKAYLAAHVSTLFGHRRLILHVNAGCAPLHKHLGKFHRGSGAAEARVGVGNERRQVIDARRSQSLLSGHAHARLPLLSIVELLRHEQVLHLVGHRVHGVIGQVGAWLVAGGRRGRALPARDVDGVEVLGHLGDLHRVQRAEGPRAGAPGLVAPQQSPQLTRLLVRRVLLLQAASQPRHLGGAVGPPGVLESFAPPPCLDLADLGVELRLLSVQLVCAGHGACCLPDPSLLGRSIWRGEATSACLWT